LYIIDSDFERKMEFSYQVCWLRNCLMKTCNAPTGFMSVFPSLSVVCYPVGVKTL